jgi:hypothetical protein
VALQQFRAAVFEEVGQCSVYVSEAEEAEVVGVNEVPSRKG